MSSFNNNGVTMKGAVIIANLVAGGTLTFTRIAVGDGTLPAGQTVLTTEKLVNHLFDVPISSVQSNNEAQAVVKGAFNNADLATGFYYREIGLFAINPETNAEELFCYGNAGDVAEWINPAGQSSLIEKEIHLVTLIGNATQVTALFDEKATVLKSEYDAAMALKADLDDTPENGGRVLAEQMRFEKEQILYVDAAAAAGGDGTEAKPFKTIAEAVAARYMGAAVIYIYIKPGTYPEKIETPHSPGVTWNFTRNGNGVVSVQGALIYNTNGFITSGLTFDMPANSADENCVQITYVNNFSLVDTTINGQPGKMGVQFHVAKGRTRNLVINNCEVAVQSFENSYAAMAQTSGAGNTRGLHVNGSIIMYHEHNLQAGTPFERYNGGAINPASWQVIDDGTTDVTTLPAGIYSMRSGMATQGLPGNYDGTLIIDNSTGHKHMMFFYDVQSKIFHRVFKSDGTGWNDWEDYIPETPTATASTFGLLRTTSVEDEQNCQCNDAAVTPESLYKLSDYRRAGVTYQADAVVACPYHVEFLLKCTQTGRTSDEALDTANVTKGQVIEDGGAKWTVIAKAIIDVSISGQNITFTFADGTTKVVTTQDSANDATDYIIESYRNGTEWYEVYKSGKVKQGGQKSGASGNSVTITLHKSLTTTSYFANPNIPLREGGYSPTIGVKSRTKTNFVAHLGSTSNAAGTFSFLWEVEGA